MTQPIQNQKSSGPVPIRVFHDAYLLNKLYGWTQQRIVYLFLPIFFSLLAALFEGLSIGLLVPLMKGILAIDFSFLRDYPIVREWVIVAESNFKHPHFVIFGSLVGIIFAASVIRFGTEYLAQLVVNHELIFFSYRLRQKLFNQMIHCGKNFFDKNNIGYLHDVLLGATGELTSGLRNLHHLLTALFMLVVYLALMLVISPSLTLLSVTLLPILHYSMTWLVLLIKKTSKSQAEQRGRLARQLSNILMCVPLVKLYCREDEEIREFGKLSEVSGVVEYSMVKKQYLLNPLQEVITLMAILILVSAATFVIFKNRDDMSALLVYFFMLRRAMGYFGVFNRMRASIAQISGPLERYHQLLTATVGQEIPQGQEEFGGLKREITFRNMNYAYPHGAQVLKNLNLSIEKGKVTALVGETGAGKSTLINLIMRFYDCAPGALYLDGVDIRNFTIKSLRRHIALVSQDTVLFNDTIRMNLLYGLDRTVSEEELVEVVRKTQLYEFIMNAPQKFDTFVGDRGVKLSGGERQRLSIARAILKNAEILIFDEATSSLDSITERLIQEAIEEAIHGKTAIIIAHRLSTIKHAEKILVLENGEIVEEGPLEALLEKKNKFYAYWQEQRFF